mmetsp:Transcript_20519/g.59531  ORF Transcript_20519/g.59531 Transcript_20519/m.59531 type:complete len:85 (-) Transcript_20519:967-1221(-)
MALYKMLSNTKKQNDVNQTMKDKAQSSSNPQIWPHQENVTLPITECDERDVHTNRIVVFSNFRYHWPKQNCKNQQRCSMNRMCQ